MRALNLGSLAILVAGVYSMKGGQKRVTDTPTKNINVATNKYIVEVEKVCCHISSLASL
jgi:hypothetical protein